VNLLEEPFPVASSGGIEDESSGRRTGREGLQSSSAEPSRPGLVFALRLPLIALSLVWASIASWPSPAALAQEWYHREGLLRGSLTSDAPPPLYDSQPGHRWNRLFAAFYIRSSALPSRPEYPQDSTRLDARAHELRGGKLPPGPVVERIEGGDAPGLLACKKTRHYSEPAVFERENQLLDEFLEAHGEPLIGDPLKWAFLQRDLWAVFDHLAGQNLARFGDADLARRRAPAHDYDLEPPLPVGQACGSSERQTLMSRPKVAAPPFATVFTPMG